MDNFFEELNDIRRRAGLPVVEANLPEKLYHGTPDEEAAKRILTNGIQPQEVKSPKAFLAPFPGRSYFTPWTSVALLYAMSPIRGKEYPYGYIFVIYKNDLLDDIQPDEDDVGEAWTFADMIARGEVDDLRKYYGDNPIARGVLSDANLQMLLQHNTNRLSEKVKYYARLGDQIWITKVGKIILKTATDALKEKLVEAGSNVSIGGPIIPSEAWRVKKIIPHEFPYGDLYGKHHIDLSDLSKVAERIR